MPDAQHAEASDVILYRVWREINHGDWWLLMDESENSATEIISLMYDIPAQELRAAPDRDAKHDVPIGVVLDQSGKTKTKGKK
jgi:hypothetical protein